MNHPDENNYTLDSYALTSEQAEIMRRYQERLKKNSGAGEVNKIAWEERQFVGVAAQLPPDYVPHGLGAEAIFDLGEVRRLHAMWVAGDPLGKRANLVGANLRGANLRGADLRGADLRGAALRRADLG